jgi:deazaflavin-dependent oxidoreductase (nitroreductase family)
MPSALGNFFVKAIATSPLHRMLGEGLGVITVEGRKTGRLYSTPINVTKENEGFTVTSLRSRSWWRNLRRGRTAQLQVSGRPYSVRGEVVEGHAEVARDLTRYFKQHPGYARYFGVRLAPDGEPIREDVERAAGERVIIHLCPAKAPG